MRFPPLVEARIVARATRFSVLVEVQGAPVLAHLANSGRVRELLAPGTPALLAPRPPAGRKTAYDLALVRVGETWVSADARLPNRLVREALAAGQIASLQPYAALVTAEARCGESRVDFLLSGPVGRCWLETKSVTLVEGGTALFPDAPTLRGVRHLRDLMACHAAGEAAAVLFVVQRADAQCLRPHDEADPLFGQTLRRAAAAGVRALAYRCRVSPCGIELTDEIPVVL